MLERDGGALDITRNGVAPPTRLTRAAMCAGVVPQQPPTTLDPQVSDKLFQMVGHRFRLHRVVGAAADVEGRPALGKQEMQRCSRRR